MKRILAVAALMCVVGLDLVGSPPLSAPPQTAVAAALPQVPSNQEQALRDYPLSASWPANSETWLWRRRTQRLLWKLLEQDPSQATPLAAAIRAGSRRETLWDIWSAHPAPPPPDPGLFAAYQQRLARLRLRQLDQLASQIQPILQEDNYSNYREAVLNSGGGSGSALKLMLSLNSQAPIRPDDLIPFTTWWQWQADRSNQSALQHLLDHLESRGGPWSWHDRAIDGQDQQGRLDFEPHPFEDGVADQLKLGDWEYRYAP